MKYLAKLLLLLGVPFLSACLKQDIRSDDLYGTWQYESVQFIGLDADSTANFKGIFRFEAPGQPVSAGGTVYGDFCKGYGEMPVLTQEYSPYLLFPIKEDILLTKEEKSNNYNFTNFYRGAFGYGYNGVIYYNNLRMCLVSKNELNMQIWLTSNSGVRFNIQKMTLKRI